jgi:hypothetical protein
VVSSLLDPLCGVGSPFHSASAHRWFDVIVVESWSSQVAVGYSLDVDLGYCFGPVLEFEAVVLNSRRLVITDQWLLTRKLVTSEGQRRVPLRFPFHLTPSDIPVKSSQINDQRHPINYSSVHLYCFFDPLLAPRISF